MEVGELQRLRSGSAVSAPAFIPASDDEQDEFTAMEEASEHARVVVAVEVDDPDAQVTLKEVASFHLDIDGSGDLAWFATQELDDVLATLAAG